MHAVCIPAAIPAELCAIDDELKAIYHSADTVCIWVFASREDRDRFMRDSAGMLKAEREELFAREYAQSE